MKFEHKFPSMDWGSRHVSHGENCYLVIFSDENKQNVNDSDG